MNELDQLAPINCDVSVRDRFKFKTCSELTLFSEWVNEEDHCIEFSGAVVQREYKVKEEFNPDPEDDPSDTTTTTTQAVKTEIDFETKYRNK